MALAALWVTSLFLPAVTFVFDTFAEPVLFPGWKILESGWIAVLAFQTGWLANLAFWALIAALLPRTPNPHLVRLTAIALLLFSAHTIDLFLRPDFHTVRSIHEGYYMWMAANVGLAVLAIFLARRKKAVAL